MKFKRLQRLHLTQGGQFLGWTDSREEASFDLLSEIRAEPETDAGEIFARHTDDRALVTADVFGATQFGVKPKDRPILEQRAKEINGDNAVDFDRVMKARWSLATPNRSNIVVPNDAWDLDKFNSSNPVGAWNHRTSFSTPDMIIARWLFTGHQNTRPTSNLIGFAELAPDEVNPLATTVLGLYRFGALNAFSPGFLVGKVTFDDDDSTVTFGSKEDPNELVELSFVPVPRHADAVRLAVDNGAVELEPLRNLITAQMETAYADPMRVVEFATLEALASKLGLVNANALVALGAEGVDALELPGGKKEPESTLASDQQIAHTLRSAEGDCPEGLDPEAWGRFAAATNDGDPDETLLVAARAAGLAQEADALERIMRLELVREGQANPESAPEVTPEENSDSDRADEEGPESFTLGEFRSALTDKFRAFRIDKERRQGHLDIPD